MFKYFILGLITPAIILPLQVVYKELNHSNDLLVVIIIGILLMDLIELILISGRLVLV